MCMLMLSTKLYISFSSDYALAQYDVESMQLESDISETKSSDLDLDFCSLDKSDQSVLLSLKQRREDILKWEKDLQIKENVINATKSHVESRINELKELEQKVENVLEKYIHIESEKIRSLVKIYENMKPQEAAMIFEDLENNTLIEVLDQMKEAKAAPILAKMNLEKARELTVLLATEGKRLLHEGRICICEDMIKN